jgi:hypothetical protein
MAAPVGGEAAPLAASHSVVPPVSQTPASFGNDRFGEPDEIDTTPRDDVPVAVPNTASSPSWSLSDANEIDTTPKDDPGSAELAAPAKKGWWQRAFKS